MPLATQRNMLRPLPHSDAVCVNAAAVSALLIILSRTGRLLPWDTQVSKTLISVNAARVASPPTMCTWTTNDDLCLRWQHHGGS